jgi:hypothetical protein
LLREWGQFASSPTSQHGSGRRSMVLIYGDTLHPCRIGFTRSANVPRCPALTIFMRRVTHAHLHGLNSRAIQLGAWFAGEPVGGATGSCISGARNARIEHACVGAKRSSTAHIACRRLGCRNEGTHDAKPVKLQAMAAPPGASDAEVRAGHPSSRAVEYAEALGEVPAVLVSWQSVRFHSRAPVGIPSNLRARTVRNE